MIHALTRTVARALLPPRSPLATRYLALLDRRLTRVARMAEGVGTPRRPEARASRALARRFLKRYEGLWSDGDENLVRGYLDAWSRDGVGPVAVARALSSCALALAAIDPPPSTLWFFLWEMESMLESGAFESRPEVPGGR